MQYISAPNTHAKKNLRKIARGENPTGPVEKLQGVTGVVGARGGRWWWLYGSSTSILLQKIKSGRGNYNFPGVDFSLGEQGGQIIITEKEKKEKNNKALKILYTRTAVSVVTTMRGKYPGGCGREKREGLSLRNFHHRYCNNNNIYIYLRRYIFNYA
jgi:hypothetical protein